MKKEISVNLQLFFAIIIVSSVYVSISGVYIFHPYHILSMVILSLTIFVRTLVGLDRIHLETFTRPRAIFNGITWSLMLLTFIFSFVLPTLRITIRSSNDFHKFKWNQSGDYYILNDIDLSGVEFDEDCYIESFQGQLIGNDYTISNQHAALFCVLSGDVTDLNLSNVVIYNPSTNITGTLALRSHGSNIVDVHIEGTIITDFHAGGIVGQHSGLIKDSSFTGIINTTSDAGGVAYRMQYGVIDNVSVSITILNYEKAAGVVTILDKGLIQNSDITIMFSEDTVCDIYCEQRGAEVEIVDNQVTRIN